MTLPDRLAVARGDRIADLLLRNGRIVDVFSGRVEFADIAIFGGQIVGIGPGYSALETQDLAGGFVVPGLIDAHVHIESSLCIPSGFATAVVPRGITSAVVDPHEIANVAGLAGVRYMVRSGRQLPLRLITMASSCVPATHMETNGADLTSDDLAGLLAEGIVHGLAEVMNFPSVIAGEPGILAKLAAFHRRPIDGHAPGLSGQALNAYAVAGIGSDHECTSREEAQEKLARGLYILIREATNAPNLRELLPMVTPQNSRRICFCTDDRVPGDLLDQGSIDYMVRTAIELGIAPIDAIRMATLNPTEWFGLPDRGAIAPGRLADLLIVDALESFSPRAVYVGGKLVATEGELVVDLPPPVTVPSEVAASVNIDWSAVNFRVPARGEVARVIGAVEGQLVTLEHHSPVKRVGDLAVADPERDLLKIAVIDRHKASGAMAVAFIHGFGLKRGAVAATVAHDHHNLIIIGADDLAMATAARAIIDMGGGLVTAEHDQVLASLALPIAGLMSDRPIQEVRTKYDLLVSTAAGLGCTLADPFMAMSFMALEVIPKLKLTDQGLVDVDLFDFVSLFLSNAAKGLD